MLRSLAACALLLVTSCRYEHKEPVARMPIRVMIGGSPVTVKPNDLIAVEGFLRLNDNGSDYAVGGIKNDCVVLNGLGGPGRSARRVKAYILLRSHQHVLATGRFSGRNRSANLNHADWRCGYQMEVEKVEPL